MVENRGPSSRLGWFRGEGSRRVGGVGVVGGIESSRDRGHERGALDRKSTTILGRGIQDLSSRPQRQRAARCSAERSGAVQRGVDWISDARVLWRCGAARLWMTARDDGGVAVWVVGESAWLGITRSFG